MICFLAAVKQTLRRTCTQAVKDKFGQLTILVSELKTKPQPRLGCGIALSSCLPHCIELQDLKSYITSWRRIVGHSMKTATAARVRTDRTIMTI